MRQGSRRQGNRSLKNRLRNNCITIGSWITTGSPEVTEIMAKSGFDWLAVDMEHSAITEDQAQQLIRIIELCEISPLVRVGENDPLLIKRVMDMGSHGIIVPMVNSKDDALRAVRAVKYPPLGTRGVGLARAQGYGLGFEKYKRWVNRESIVIVQIEHIDAVANLGEILQIEGVDGFIVGPYDLSASLGVPGDFKHKSFLSALKKIGDVSNKYHVVSGFHVIQPTAREVLAKIRQGYKFIGFSLDALILGMKCNEELVNLAKRRAR